MKYKSLLQADTDSCYFCGRPATEWHHIFNGADKKRSEKYGAMVHLCHMCHNAPPNEKTNFKGGLHYNYSKWNELKAKAQAEIIVQNNMSLEKWKKEFDRFYF